MVLTKLIYLEQAYSLLKTDSSYNSFSKVNIFMYFSSSVAYESMATALNSFVTDNYGSVGGAYNKLRVTITDADGTTVYDSSRINNSDPLKLNTYTNYTAKTINENHNSRLSIMTALVSNGGVGKEQKWSTSDSNFQQYLSVRIGLNSEAAYGVIRISVV